MNPKTLVIAVICLGVGVAGGVIVTNYWQADRTSANVSESEHENHDEHDPSLRAEKGFSAQPFESEHENHDEHDEAQVVRLPEDELLDAGIEIAEAKGGVIERVLMVAGEVVLNADRVAHMVPRVAGIVRQVTTRLGDRVKESEVMAVLESRELAEAKSDDIAAEERLTLARANFTRAEQLKARGISSEEDYLTAKQQLAEAQIEHRKTEARLHAFGLSQEQVENVSREPDTQFSIYELRAPFDGTVIDRHMTLGELVGNTSDVFLLADLSTVWVNLTVYQKDLASVRIGQSVMIAIGHGVPDACGTIEYVSPVVQEATRTATARVVLANPEGHWRPGLFVAGSVQTETFDVPVLVPKTALQTINGKTCVFVATDDGFEPREVTVGRSDSRNVEITRGLKPGERYVSVNAFTLKSELGKAGFEAGHAH